MWNAALGDFLAVKNLVWGQGGTKYNPGGGVQGVVKAGLVRVKEGHGSRARELAEEELALQEGLDGTRHALSERAEENAALSAQACRPLLSMAYIMLSVREGARMCL